MITLGSHLIMAALWGRSAD